MRHKKILLGAVATVMGAGLALAPAKAADVNGLVTTMVDYVASCGNGAGVTFNNTCVTISGGITFGTIGHGETISFGADATGNTATAENDQLNVSFTPKLGFAWQSGGYDVKIAFPLTDPGDVEVDISRPGGIAIHLERYGLTGNSVVVSMPFNAFKVTLGADFDGGDPDLDLDVTGAFGDVTVGFGVHSDDWNDPTFDATLGFTFGDWSLTLRGATRGWAPWEPTVYVDVAGTFGAFKVDMFLGWQDNDGNPNDRAIGARVRTDLGGNSITVAGIHGRGDADWDGWTDDFGTHPYSGLGFGDSFFAVWAGLSRTWNSEHTSSVAVFYTDSDNADSQYLRFGVTHVWTPVGGAVTVTGNAWVQHDFCGGGCGGVGTVFGANVKASLSLVR